MRTYSLIELFNMTRAELFALHAQIADEVSRLPEHSGERAVTIRLMRAIRHVLARKAPGS